MAFKLRTRTLFPALVSVSSPIVLTKSGASYIFSFDANALTSSLDATLQALAALDSTAGLLTQTGVDTFTKRTLNGTAAEITVTNGDGSAGAPTVSLPAALTFTGKTVTGGTFSSPTLVTPALGAATATSINKVTVTTPATNATLTLIDGTVLTGPAASGTVMTLGNAETVTGVKTFGSAGAVGRFKLAGTTSGTITLDATAVAGANTLTLPAETATLITAATTKTLTNTTLNSAGTGNTLQVSGVTVSAGQYPGEPTTGSATAGNVGEYIESVIAAGSATALTTATAKTVTSIALTAGDWDVAASAAFVGAGGVSITMVEGSISLSTNTVDETLGRCAKLNLAANVPGTSPSHQMAVGPVRISVSGATTVFLVANSQFTIGTLSGYGIIRARRVR